MPNTPKSITSSFNAKLKPIKDMFKLYEGLGSKTWKETQKRTKLEKQRYKEQQKELKDSHKLRLTQIKEEVKADTAAHKNKVKGFKEQENLQTKQDRSSKRQRREEAEHLDGINRRLSRGPLGRAGNFLGRTAAFAGGGLAGLVVGAALRGYQNYTAYQQALGPTIGLGGRGGREAARAGRGKGGNLGFNIMERAQLIPAMARSTGVVSPRAMMQGMRATGMEAGEVAEIFGAIRQGGTQFAGTADVFGGKKDRTVQLKGQGSREFSKMIAAGMFSGLEKARLPEFMSGIAQLMKVQGTMAAGTVTGGDFAKLGAVFGRTGLEGMKGARGMELMSKLQQGILAPGGGESGMAFMRQAMGFGKPGGGASFYEAEKRREKGLSGENFGRVMGELKSQYGGGQDAALKMRELFGVSLKQAETLMKIYDSDKTMEEKEKEAQKVMEESKSLEQKSYEEMKKAGTNLTKQAALFDDSVKIGSETKGYIEGIEKAIMDLTKFLIKHIPDILAVLKIIARTAIIAYNKSVGWVFGKQIPMPDVLREPWEKIYGTEEEQTKSIQDYIQNVLGNTRNDAMAQTFARKELQAAIAGDTKSSTLDTLFKIGPQIEKLERNVALRPKFGTFKSDEEKELEEMRRVQGILEEAVAAEQDAAARKKFFKDLKEGGDKDAPPTELILDPYGKPMLISGTLDVKNGVGSKTQKVPVGNTKQREDSDGN